jgi:hypothetical protein
VLHTIETKQTRPETTIAKIGRALVEPGKSNQRLVAEKAKAKQEREDNKQHLGQKAHIRRRDKRSRTEIH